MQLPNEKKRKKRITPSSSNILNRSIQMGIKLIRLKLEINLFINLNIFLCVYDIYICEYEYMNFSALYLTLAFFSHLSHIYFLLLFSYLSRSHHRSVFISVQLVPSFSICSSICYTEKKENKKIK